MTTRDAILAKLLDIEHDIEQLDDLAPLSRRQIEQFLAGMRVMLATRPVQKPGPTEYKEHAE